MQMGICSVFRQKLSEPLTQPQAYVQPRNGAVQPRISWSIGLGLIRDESC
jgi:hypothetical protein